MTGAMPLHLPADEHSKWTEDRKGCLCLLLKISYSLYFQVLYKVVDSEQPGFLKFYVESTSVPWSYKEFYQQLPLASSLGILHVSFPYQWKFPRALSFKSQVSLPLSFQSLIWKKHLKKIQGGQKLHLPLTITDSNLKSGSGKDSKLKKTAFNESKTDHLKFFMGDIWGTYSKLAKRYW